MGIMAIEKINVRIKKLDERAIIPTYGTENAAGADLYALLDNKTVVNPGETVKFGTGIALEIPQGLGGFVYARSGLSCKKGLAPANKVGVVDSDYRGEIFVFLHNHSDAPVIVANGDRIAQLVIAPYYYASFEEVDFLEETKRSDGGFGSTGR